MGRETLNYEQKHFIVTRLARRWTPSEVAAALSKEFSLKVARQKVEKYDPTRKNGRRLSAKWRDFFYRERVMYDLELEGRLAIPSQHKVDRR